MESVVMVLEDEATAHLHCGNDYKVNLQKTGDGISMELVEMEIIVDRKQIPELEPGASGGALLGRAEGSSLFDCMCEVFRQQKKFFEEVAGYMPVSPDPCRGFAYAVEFYEKGLFG